MKKFIIASVIIGFLMTAGTAIVIWSLKSKPTDNVSSVSPPETSQAQSLIPADIKSNLKFPVFSFSP